MKVTSISAFGLSLVFVTAAAVAHAHTDEINCGKTYVVEPADSLSNISAWAYGTTAQVEMLHQRNIDVIGRDPGNIEVGMELFIPCLDEAITPETGEETPVAAEAEPESEESTAEASEGESSDAGEGDDTN